MKEVEWSDVEIEATVKAYLRMLLNELNGQSVNKAYENSALREGALAGRSKGSIEFRMQNISLVLDQLGLKRIKGYKPAKNIGSGVASRIYKAISQLENLQILKSTPGWLEDQKNSILYRYLASNSPHTIRDITDTALSSENSEQVINYWPEESTNKPELEEEIVEAIKGGKPLEDLTKEAYQHLSKLGVIWSVLEKLSILITLIMFVPALQSSIDSLKTPNEIRAKINTIPSQQRALIAGSSIVVKDDVILRAKPNKSSTELGRLMKGTWVENLETETTEWVHVKVEIDGKSIDGWIFRSYLVRL